jgi:Spy/CpxP family protein refolding chaperone
MKKNIFLIIFLSLVINGLFSNSLAQGRYFGDEFPPPKHLIEKLQLSDAQQDKFEEFRFNHQKEMIDLRADLQQKILEFRKYLSSDNVSRNKVIGLTKEINEIRNKMALARANHKMDIYELLDDTQRKIWHDNRPFGFGFMDNNFKGRGMFRHWRGFCR